MNYNQQELRNAVMKLRASKYRKEITVEVAIVSSKKYKKSNYIGKGLKGTLDRMKWDALMKQANGRPIKWVESEMGLMDIPREWTKTVRMPLDKLLNNWKEIL